MAVRAKNITAATPPFYLTEGMKYSKSSDGTQGTIIMDTTAGGFDSPYTGDVDGWEFTLIVSAISQSGLAWTRKDVNLTGFYDQEKILYPVGANVQTPEPPLWRSKNANNKYLREVELWTTQRLTDSEVSKAVNFAIPLLPGFPASPASSDAYMSSSQLIAGRSRVYSGNGNFSNELGFGTLVHESIIGEGNPIAAPDLHYVRAYYWWADYQYVVNWLCADFPSMRDILTVAEVNAKDDISWMTNVVRGAAPDAR